MKRSPLPSRRQPLARSKKPIKKKARSKSERERIYGPPGYVEWIHQQECACCGIVGYSVTAHIGNGGTGRKSDWTQTIPLCSPNVYALRGEGCHFLYDEKPWLLKEVYPRFHVFTAMAKTQAAWQEYSGTSNKDEA